jgi:hypothetical protein
MDIIKDQVVHLFRWVILQYVGQPFTPEFHFFVLMDRRLFETDKFSPRRMLTYMWFRRYLRRSIFQRRLLYENN